MMKMVEKKQKQEQITSGSSSRSRSNVELTEDLILEICSHIHPISLLRFKSVSKKWYSLISNPHFLVRHTLVLHRQFLRSRDSPLLIHPHSILLQRYSNAGKSNILILPPPPPTPPQNDDDDEEEGEGDRKLSPLLLQKLIHFRPEQDVHEKFMLVDSCNGLLLYTNRLKYRIHEKRNWYVCNPITHDYIKLPTLLFEEQGFKTHSYSSHSNIVFQPSSLSLTFKVITWLICQRSRYNLEEEKEYRLYVYSSETRSWRLSITINDFPFDPRLFNFAWRGVLCNGVLYWSSLNPPTHVSLCYDVEKDRISTLKFPNLPVGYTDRTLYYFGECGGRLRLIENFYNHVERRNNFLSIFDAMEFNEDQQQKQDDNAVLWTLKYHVNIGEEGYYADLIRKYSSYVNIFDFYKTKTKKAGGEEEEEEVMLLRISNVCIIPFNLSSNTFGKELRNGKKRPVMSQKSSGFTEVLRYNTITLFPPSSSW